MNMYVGICSRNDTIMTHHTRVDLKMSIHFTLRPLLVSTYSKLIKLVKTYSRKSIKFSYFLPDGGID